MTVTGPFTVRMLCDALSAFNDEAEVGVAYGVGWKPFGGTALAPVTGVSLYGNASSEWKTVLPCLVIEQ